MRWTAVGSIIDTSQYASRHEFLRHIAPFSEWYCKEFRIGLESEGHMAMPLMEARRLYSQHLIKAMFDASLELERILISTDSIYASSIEGYRKKTPIKDEVFRERGFGNGT